MPTDGVAIPRITTDSADWVSLVFYPWYCHAIRGTFLFCKVQNAISFD
jgi:hypothetical protein